MYSSQFWRLEDQDEDASMVRFLFGSSSRLQMAGSSLYPYMAERKLTSSLTPLCKGTNLIHMSVTLMT